MTLKNRLPSNDDEPRCVCGHRRGWHESPTEGVYGQCLGQRFGANAGDDEWCACAEFYAAAARPVTREEQG